VTGSAADWVAHRSEAARVQADRLRERQEALNDKAEGIIAEFMPAVRAYGPSPEALRVVGYGGAGTARTPLTGWYLRINKTAGIDVDGNFYVLTAPLSTMDRLRGVHPKPSRPPMVLGEGGRDGESIDLPVALERLLPGWRGLVGQLGRVRQGEL
jgi:hypothetical protein